MWPAYVAAHEPIFEDGDIEHGKPNGRVPGLLLFDALNLSMSEMIERVCGVLDSGLRGES